MENEIQLKVCLPLYLEHFECWIVAALEGGSNYWYYLPEINLEGRNEGEPLSMFIARKLFTDPTYVLPVYDIENEDEHLGDLTQESILKTIERGLTETGYAGNVADLQSIIFNLLSGDIDADQADIFFQEAVMGEVVFC